jgi:hypothetical protein
MIQNLHKTRHVRALKIMRQMHVHIKSGDGVLHPHALVFNHHGMANAFNAHLVNRQVAGVGTALHVWYSLSRIHGELSKNDLRRL